MQTARSDRREERSRAPRAEDEHTPRLWLLENLEKRVGRGTADRFGALHDQHLGALIPLSRQGEELLGARQILDRENRRARERRDEERLARHAGEHGSPGLGARLLGLALGPSLGPERRKREQE